MDEVLIGDWDGNGTDTLGVRRPVGQAPASDAGAGTAGTSIGLIAKVS